MDKSKLSAREIAFARDSYDDCIADLDEQLGRLLDELERRGILESTWLLITSDHGESFGEQPGVFIHGTSLYQPQLHVPLVIVPPSGSPRPARGVVPEIVSLRDLPATIVDLLDLEGERPVSRHIAGPALGQPAKAGSGRSRGFRRRRRRSRRSSRPTRSTRTRQNCLRTDGRGHRWPKATRIYIRIRQGDLDHEELFDLREDPRQSRNLAQDPARRSILERMRATLDRLTGRAAHARAVPAVKPGPREDTGQAYAQTELAGCCSRGPRERREPAEQLIAVGGIEPQEDLEFALGGSRSWRRRSHRTRSFLTSWLAGFRRRASRQARAALAPIAILEQEGGQLGVVFRSPGVDGNVALPEARWRRRFVSRGPTGRPLRSARFPGPVAWPGRVRKAAIASSPRPS